MTLPQARRDAQVRTRSIGEIKRSVKEELLKPQWRACEVGSITEVVLHDKGLASQLYNRLYAQCKDGPPQAPGAAGAAAGGAAARTSSARTAESPLPLPRPTPPPPSVAASAAPADELEAVSILRERWINLLGVSVQRLAEESGMPLMHGRAAETDIDAATAASVAARRAQRSRQKGVYTADDLLDVISAYRHPNATGSAGVVRPWTLVPFSLGTPSLADCAARFDALQLGRRQGGLDDMRRGWYAEERQRMGEKVLADGYTPLLLQLAKSGVPTGLRGRLWRVALHTDDALGPRGFNHYRALQREVHRVAQVLDPLVRRDAASPFLEPDYFVFEQSVEEALLAFMRDPTVSAASAENCTGLVALDRNSNRALFPPNGWVPPRGLCQYVYPLCYLYSRQEELYHVHVALWNRYWCRLHALSSRRGSILHLTAMLEGLLQELCPSLCLHLLEVGLHPTRVAFRWLVYAFAGYLSPSQTLLLWDRIIGFDTLELLPLLALAIFLFRKEALLKAQTAEHALAVLSDASQLRVTPLLQAVLFAPGKLASLENC